MDSSNSSNKRSYPSMEGWDIPMLGLTKEQMQVDIDRYSLLADTITGDLTHFKCVCHKNKYSPVTHANCKMRCAKLAKKHILHTALSRKYLKEYFDHLETLTSEHEIEAARKLADLKEWYKKTAPVRAQIVARPDILEYINSPSPEDIELAEALKMQAGSFVDLETGVEIAVVPSDEPDVADWGEAVLALDDGQLIPDDPDGEFDLEAALVNAPFANIVSHFQSIGGHVQRHTVRWHFDALLDIESTSYLAYIEAREQQIPNLRQICLGFILTATMSGVESNWNLEISLDALMALAYADYRSAMRRNRNVVRYYDRTWLGPSISPAYSTIDPTSRLRTQAGIADLPAVINRFNTKFNAAMFTDQAKLADFVENIILYYQEYKMCKTFSQFALCFYKYLKMQFGISIGMAAYSWISSLVNLLRDEFQEQARPAPHCEFETQGGFADFVEGYKTATQSAVFERMTKLSVLIGSLAMCWVTSDTLTMTKFSNIIASIYSGLKSTDVLGQILESIQMIYARCIPVLRGEEAFSTLWQGLGDGRQLDLDIVTFIGHANKFIEGTADETTPHPQALIIKAGILLDKLEKLLKATIKDNDRIHVKRSILQVEGLRNSVNNAFNNMGVRAKPYTVSLFGDTGVGKSCLSFDFAVMLQRALEIDAGSQYIFRLDEQDKYHSALTNQHNCYIFDDVGNLKPEHAEVPTTDPIITISNNCPKFAVKADLASKGVVAMKPKIFILSTNVKSLHSRVFSVCPAAPLRRVEAHITVVVKPEFADTNGMLREDVDPDAIGYNCWLFTVQRFSPNTEHPLAERGFEPITDQEGVTLVNVNYEVVCRYLVNAVRQHHRRQDAYVEQTRTAHTVAYCACNIRASACTRCEHPQSGILQDNKIFIDRVMGFKEVVTYPMGRKLIYEMNKQMLIHALEWTIGCALIGTTVQKLWLLGLWAAILLAFILINMYRIYTYTVKYDYAGVVSALVVSQRDRLLGSKAKIAASFITLIGLYLSYRKMQVLTEPQGSEPSRPRVTFDVGKLPDAWKRVEVAPVPRNDDLVTMTGTQLAGVLQEKMCSLRVFTDTKHEFAATFPVCTNFWLVPHHVITKDYEKVKVIHASEEVINFAATTYREGSYRRIGKTDFALLYMPGKGDQLDMLKYFPSKSMFADGKMQLRDVPAKLALLEQRVKEIDQARILEPIRSTHGIRVTSGLVAPQGIDVPYWGGSYQSPVLTFQGMCGCPIVTEGSGPYIVGMHSAGITGRNVASYGTIMKEDLLECIAEMTSKDTPMMQGSETGAMNIDSEIMPFKHMVPDKNHIAFMQNAEVDIVGCHAGRKRRYTSMVQATDYSDDIEELFQISRKHGKPALMNHWYPARLWAESCANAKPVNMKYLQMAFTSYTTKIFQFLKEEHKEDICVLEDVVNTSGLDGVKGLYKMNYAASAGIPYCKPKRDYVKESKDFFDGITVPYELTEDMRADVKLLEDIYKSGKRGYAPHRANRKDEAIKLEKAKVRIFSGTSMPYLFLMRKYFLSMSVFMQKYPEIFESAVGINPYSSEWTRLYNYITKHGKNRMVAGDYEKYDQFVHSMMTYAAFKVMILIAEWAGYDEEDLMVMRGLATDTCNPLYELDGLWLKFGGSSPSGHALTVVINGIVNSFYARIAFYKTREKETNPGLRQMEFNDNVAFMSYGDDNVMSVSKEAGFFNHCTYQSALADYGLNYTMADKTATSVPYIGMEEVSFLKRTWVWSEQFQKHLAPLESASIFKMLHTFTVSKAAPRQQQLADILRSANQEFFMHGRETFEASREKLLKIADIHQLRHYLPNLSLPGFPEMETWYAEAG